MQFYATLTDPDDKRHTLANQNSRELLDSALADFFVTNDLPERGDYGLTMLADHAGDTRLTSRFRVSDMTASKVQMVMGLSVMVTVLNTSHIANEGKDFTFRVLIDELETGAHKMSHYVRCRDPHVAYMLLAWTLAASGHSTYIQEITQRLAKNEVFGDAREGIAIGVGSAFADYMPFVMSGDDE